MNKSLRKLILSLFIIVLPAFIFIQARAFSTSTSPLAFFYRTADIITSRVSDIIYYLVMQKRYLFDGYIDPNSQIPSDIYAVVDKATTTMSSSSPVVTSEIIEKVIKTVTTPTIPQPIKPTTSNPVSAKETIVTPTVVTTNSLSPVAPVEPKVKVSEPPTYVANPDNDNQILKYTNIERLDESLAPLSGNSVLDAIASLRADDLFDFQYFEHSSPDGKTASGLAKSLGYEYLLIGENLAMGDFKNDQAIVTAWMDSPGHKANILNEKYSELGVSVKEGIFNDESTIIAVQIFGLPLGDCAKPDSGTKNLIDSMTASTKEMQEEALVLYNELTAIQNSSELDISYYNQKIQEYNYMAKKVNESVITLKKIVDYYNEAVNNYNSCIKP